MMFLDDHATELSWPVRIGLLLAGVCCYLLATRWKTVKRGAPVVAGMFGRLSRRWRRSRRQGEMALPLANAPVGSGDPIDSLTLMLEGLLKQQRERLESGLPDPTQASLDAMLAQVTCVRVLEGEMMEGKAPGKRTMLETDDPASIAALACALAVVDGRTWHHSCAANQTIECYEGPRLAATIGLLPLGIRWDAWNFDAELRDRTRLEQWLTERGVVLGGSESNAEVP